MPPNLPRASSRLRAVLRPPSFPPSVSLLPRPCPLRCIKLNSHAPPPAPAETTPAPTQPAAPAADTAPVETKAVEVTAPATDTAPAVETAPATAVAAAPASAPAEEKKDAPAS